MSVKFNLSYKFNKLQKIHNAQLNKVGKNNFEELLKINSQSIVNTNHISMIQGPSLTLNNNTLLDNQLLSINNQTIDSEILSNINSLNNTSNNISSIIEELYGNENLNTENSSLGNTSNTVNNNSSNNTQNSNQNTSIDLSPSKVDYKNSNGDVFDKTKAKPSYSEIESLVEKYSKKYNIDASLVMAIIKAESSFNNQCISRSGAVGLIQLMPVTAREMGLKVDSTIDERWDPEKNIEAGIAYIAKYHKIISNHFGKEDWNLTLAGYNCGPNRVIKEGKIPKITETQNYVKKVNKYWNEFKEQGY